MTQDAPPAPRTALVTASYAPDFERCRILCDTADRFVTGLSHHYLLVAGEDVALFRGLEGPRRTVVDERDLLPGWLRSFRDPSSGARRRRVWLSPFTLPLRGWHVQQLRRIAIAAHVDEEALFYADSDVAFLKPFDAASLWRDDRLRLFRRDGELAARPDLAGHRLWSAHAARILGLPAEPPGVHDYVATLVAWRRDAVLTMQRRIERSTGRHWVAAVAGWRRFSECMIYGRYVDDVRGGAGHFRDSTELCRVHWTGRALSPEETDAFLAGLGPDQVAVGLQSFIGTDLGPLRRALAA